MSNDIVESRRLSTPFSRGILKQERIVSLPDPYSNENLFKKAAYAYAGLCLHFGYTDGSVCSANAFSDSPPGSFDKLVSGFKAVTSIAGGRMIVHGSCFSDLGFSRDPTSLAYAIIVQSSHIDAKGNGVKPNRTERVVALNAAAVAEEDSAVGLPDLKRCRVSFVDRVTEAKNAVKFAADETSELTIATRSTVVLNGKDFLVGGTKAEVEHFYMCLKSALGWNTTPVNDGNTVGKQMFKYISENPSFTPETLEMAADKLKRLVDFLEDNHYGVFTMSGSRGPCVARINDASACLEVASRIMDAVNRRRSAAAGVADTAAGSSVLVEVSFEDQLLALEKKASIDQCDRADKHTLYLCLLSVSLWTKIPQEDKDVTLGTELVKKVSAEFTPTSLEFAAEKLLHISNLIRFNPDGKISLKGPKGEVAVHGETDAEVCVEVANRLRAAIKLRAEEGKVGV